MVKTKNIKILLITSLGEEFKEIKARLVKGTKKRDVLTTLHLPYSFEIIYKKTRKILDNNTDIWDLIKDDKKPVLCICAP